MEQTFVALGGIVLKAIPTVVILLFLHFYLKGMLFRPLQKVLEQRDELTAGARKAAEVSLAAAERKAQEYEGKLNEARAEVYRQQEETRKQWLKDQAAQTGDARARMESNVKEARARIGEEAAAARQSLQQTSETLADQIAARIITHTSGEPA